MNKRIITKNFNRSADFYDQYASVQRYTAKKLKQYFPDRNNIKSIIDIGCGTGIMTEAISEAYTAADILGIDISERMINVAKKKLNSKNIRFMVSDAEKLNTDKKADLLISNASLHWLSDIEKSLADFRDILSKNGIIIFSVFGPETYKELNTALKKLSGKEISFTSSLFPKKKQLLQIMNKIYKKAIIKEERYIEKIKDVRELLNRIKYTGTRGVSFFDDIVWTRGKIMELNIIYKKIYKNIVVTNHLLYCRGEK